MNLPFLGNLGGVIALETCYTHDIQLFISIRLELSSREKLASKIPSINLVGVLFWVHGDRTVAGLWVRCGMMEVNLLDVALAVSRGDFLLSKQIP
jgi:hypothetical protein